MCPRRRGAQDLSAPVLTPLHRVPGQVKSHLFSLPTFEEEEESRCLVVDAAPIHRQPGAMSDGIDRFLGGLANAPESDDVEANMVTLPFLGAGRCGAGALLKLRGEDGTLSPLTGEDADLILPLLVLVTTTAVRSTEELTLYYGPEYFPVLAEVCEDAAAVKREEQRIAAAGASSAAVGPSSAVQPAGNSAGGGGDGGVGAKAKGRGPFWSKMEWIKPLVHPPPPRVSEDLMQMDHECATNATMDDVKQGVAIRLGGERPNGRTLFNIDVFIAAEQRAMVMLNKGVDFGKGLGSAFAGDILRYLHVHKSCPGMESDTACEVAFNKKFWRLAKLGPLEEYWSVQTDKIYELWERERQAAIAAGRPPPYSDAFYKERLEPALARAAAGPAAPGLVAGSSSADEETPGEQSDDAEGDDENGEMDDDSFGFGGGDVDDIVQGEDQTPVPMAVDAQMAEEAPAPEAAAPMPVAVQAVAAEEPAAEAVAAGPVPAATELPVGQDGDVLGDMNVLNAQLADAKTQLDVFAQTAHARQSSLAAAAQAARQRAGEAMQLALAAQQAADGADAALAAAKADDEARMDDLRASVRRLTGVKRKREAEAEAEDAERKLAAEQQNVAAALAALEAAKAVAEAAREKREKLLHGGSQDTD
jgi:hypothetical protein